MKHTFTCFVCGETKTYESDITTGYGRDKDNNKVCFECCGKRDLKDLLNMQIGKDKMCMYLVKRYIDKEKGIHKWFITNWPGTFEKQVIAMRENWHNWAGTRYDFWFTMKNEGEKQYYHGFKCGNNTDICHIKRITEKSYFK